MNSGNKDCYKELSDKELKDLKKIFKLYSNFYKALYLFDPALSSEFKIKNELYMNQKFKKKNKSHIHSDNQSSCCSGKFNNKIYIPKDKQNNVEKILYEIYESFYFTSNLSELLEYLSNKFEKITNTGFKDGMKLNEESEKDLIHKLCLEGTPFYIFEKIKISIKKYEESISEQPMLLAHPSGITNKDLIRYLNPCFINNLVEKHYFYKDEKLYENIDEYKLYDEFIYLYSEGYFEDISLKIEGRKDFIYKYNINYFKNTKHRQINDFSNLVYCLPFELNSKLPNLSLQTNDYIIISYFRENHSQIMKNIDSSFGNDSGKKISAIIPIFSRDLEISKRKIKIKLYFQNRESVSNKTDDDLNFNNEKETDKKIEVELTKPLSLMVFKSRIFSYEVETYDFPFMLAFYYMHGPIDKDNFSA